MRHLLEVVLHRWLFVVVLLVGGCTGFNDAMTPGVEVIQDQYYGTSIVRQAPVSAAQSLSEAWHTLGFEWVEKTPNRVYITAGIEGVRYLTGVEFKADGSVIDKIEPAAIMTELEYYAVDLPTWSGRRFVMSWDDFQVIATAQTVLMRLDHVDKYSVSSFGQSRPKAIVTAKFGPFLAKVREIRGG